MVEKTYHLALYLGSFNAYLMPQGFKGVPIYQNFVWTAAVNSLYLQSGHKIIIFAQKRPQQTIW